MNTMKKRSFAREKFLYEKNLKMKAERVDEF